MQSFLKNYGRIECISLACLGTISCDDGSCTVTVKKQEKKNQWSVLKPVSSFDFDDECAPWKLNDGVFALPFKGDSYINTVESNDKWSLQFPESGRYVCFVVLCGLRVPHHNAFVSAKSVNGELLRDGKCLLDQDACWVSLINLQIKKEADREIRFVLRNFSECDIDKLDCGKSMLFIFHLNG